MFNRFPTVLAATIALSAAASAPAQTVGSVCFDLTLSIPEGGSILAGKTVQWTITVRASLDDHQGLALGLVDLVQDLTNPAPINLVAGVRPADMASFDLPLGIANKGPSAGVSGYGGTPIPDPAAPAFKRLIQIGGAQNNFGVSGISGFAQNTTVQPGVAQSALGRVLARGSFAAPSTVGSYCLRLLNPIANVLTDVQPAPGLSRTAPAAASLCDGVVCFSVVRRPPLDVVDIERHVLPAPEPCVMLDCLLAPPPPGSPPIGDDSAMPDTLATFSPCRRADLDGDGRVTIADLHLWIDAYFRGRSAPDEPTRPGDDPPRPPLTPPPPASPSPPSPSPAPRR